MTSLRDYEAGRDAAAAKKLPLLCCGSSGRPSFAWAARRSFIGTVLLWTCLVLAGVVLAGLLSPLLSPGGELPRLRLRVARAERDDAAAAELATPPMLAADTLVLYVFSNTDPESERNLGFFVRHGMAEGDGCDYVVIVQQGNELFSSTRLPDLPANAQYLPHENRCFDWGANGWAVAEGKVAPTRYSHIILVNSSVRGPYLPAYWPAGVHWSAVLTTRLNDMVKLVGPTISCEPAYLAGEFAKERHQNAHVQSYVIATDQVGFGLLQRDKRIFECYEDLADTVFYSEVGASRAILAANYTIDSLMLRYQGVDWTDKANWHCNAGLNPCGNDAYDGVSLSPLETMFVKVKGFQLEGDWAAARTAAAYDRWLAQGPAGDITSNDYAAHTAAYKLPRALAMQRRGRACFDHEFYRNRSRDLPRDWEATQLWDHFVENGHFEGRTFRFHCESPLRNEAVAAAVIRASGRPAELDRIMATAAEAARASSPPATAHVTEVQAGTAMASSAAATAAAVTPTPDAGGAGSAGDSAPGPIPGAPALMVRRAA